MSVEHIPPGSVYRASKNYFDAKKKEAKPVKDKGVSKTSSSDKVEISRQARDLNKKEAILLELKEALRKLPGTEVREDRIKQAVTRMITGYYNRGFVQEKTAESMLLQPGVDKASHPKYSKAASGDVDWQKIKQVQKRIMDNYYDSINVIEEVVNKLLSN